MRKVILSYSGGLDTSVLIKMIQEKLESEVVTLIVDVGQQEDFEEIVAKSEPFEVDNIIDFVKAVSNLKQQYSAKTDDSTSLKPHQSLF